MIFIKLFLSYNFIGESFIAFIFLIINLCPALLENWAVIFFDNHRTFGVTLIRC